MYLQGKQEVTRRQGRGGYSSRRCQISGRSLNHLHRENRLSIFHHIAAVEAPSVASSEEGLPSTPTLAVLSVQGPKRTPLQHTRDSQGFPWLPTCRLPILTSWAQQTHPQPSLHSPGLFTEIPPKGQNLRFLIRKFSTHFPTREDSFSKDIQMGRESHLLGSQRLDFGDKVLNCCPLLTLDSQQSALRSAIITILKNSPFVSCT